MLSPSPFRIFSRSSRDRGQITIQLSFPWPLPWSIDALRAALAWEVVWNCEKWQQLIARTSSETLRSYAESECGPKSNRWLDGAFNRNVRRILESVREDLSRVNPRPALLITTPQLNQEDE